MDQIKPKREGYEETSLVEELHIQYQQIEQEGISAEELTFQFSCQYCGFRCCTDPHIQTVQLSPYSFAYIRQQMTSEQVEQLFQLKTLQWVVTSLKAPKLQVGGIVCPFLIMFWGIKLYIK